MLRYSSISPYFYSWLILQCENLSEETGCWLYIASQHVTASEPFIWFASKRLVNEACDDLNIIHNNMAATMSGLVTARREEALRLAKNLAAAEEKAAMAEDKASDAESRNRALEDEIIKKNALIAKLQEAAATSLSL